ncbi:DNA replication protein psf1 [Paraphaeosphaeria minitans]
MYGEIGNKLVQHAKRTQSLAHLPPYQTELVRAVTREVRDLDKDVATILEPFAGSFDPSTEPATACALLVNHLCMRRDKRCLLAYHRTRTDKLEEMCWSGIDVLERQQQLSQKGGGDGAGAQMGTDGAGSSLSPEEEEYVRQYSDLLASYKGQWTDIDLTGSLEPPKDLFIDVRVLKDAGEIQTEYGYTKLTSGGMSQADRCRAITLTKNSQFFVRQGDVERLIQQGYLQRLS